MADVRVCAAASGLAQLNENIPFEIDMSDGHQTNSWSSIDYGIGSSSLTDVASVGPGECVRGTITFEVPVGWNATSVDYLGAPWTTVRWMVDSSPA